MLHLSQSNTIKTGEKYRGFISRFFKSISKNTLQLMSKCFLSRGEETWDNIYRKNQRSRGKRFCALFEVYREKGTLVDDETEPDLVGGGNIVLRRWQLSMLSFLITNHFPNHFGNPSSVENFSRKSPPHQWKVSSVENSPRKIFPAQNSPMENSSCGKFPRQCQTCWKFPFPRTNPCGTSPHEKRS